MSDLTDLERTLRDRLDAIGPAPRAVLLHTSSSCPTTSVPAQRHFGLVTYEYDVFTPEPGFPLPETIMLYICRSLPSRLDARTSVATLPAEGLI